MSHKRSSFFWLVGSVGAGSLFALLAGMRLQAWDRALDHEVSRFFLMLPDSSIGMTLMKGVSLFGRELLVVSVGVVGLGLLLYRRWERSILLLGSVLGAGILNEWVRHRLEVLRPMIGHPEIFGENDGFPSGHTMMATVMYGLMLALFLPSIPHQRRFLVIGCTVLLLLLIGMSRLYLGHHYLSDVLGGYVAGSAWLTVCLASATWLKHLGARVSSHPHPMLRDGASHHDP